MDTKLLEKDAESLKWRLVQAHALAKFDGDEDWTTLAMKLSMIQGVCDGQLPLSPAICAARARAQQMSVGSGDVTGFQST